MLIKTLSLISVTFTCKGFHRYPDAPDDVAYLKLEHRHLFKFKVSIQVFHDNRELEFHQFLNWLESLVGTTISVDHKSCEMISDDLAKTISDRYPNRFLQIEVWEDGECGSITSYNT